MRFLYIYICFFLITNITFSQIINLKIDNNAVYFTEGNDSILVYQIAEKSINGQFARNNYIHPLYTLDGQILTEDFPKDHPHHRGIFWAWHQLYIGDKRLGDGWELENFYQEINEVKQLKTKGTSKSIKTTVFWKSNLWLDEYGKEKPMVKENTTITVYPKKNNSRLIIVKISLFALEPYMRIGGSTDAKGYGGFSPRIKLFENTKFTGSHGTVTPNILPIKADGWLDISGPYGQNKTMAGLTILCLPNNPGYPSPWILRAKNSMQNAVFPHPGAKTTPLYQEKPITLSYGLLIHNGTANEVNIERLYEKYKITRP
ncbi:DUF6807 family protein [Wenyingzhuangia sp. IMCC45467]